MRTIFLARHATPDWSRTEFIYHIPPGPPLIEKGLAEAAQLGEFLQLAGVRLVFASPLDRCHHTARIVQEMTQANLEVAEGLAEVRPGETSIDLVKRVLPVFERAAEASPTEGPVALITHGGPVESMLRYLGMEDQVLREKKVYDHSNLLPPAGAWQVSRNGDSSTWDMQLAFVPSIELTFDTAVHR
jgi:broad specificity phosphatase PhoE